MAEHRKRKLEYTRKWKRATKTLSMIVETDELPLSDSYDNLSSEREIHSSTLHVPTHRDLGSDDCSDNHADDGGFEMENDSNCDDHAASESEDDSDCDSHARFNEADIQDIVDSDVQSNEEVEDNSLQDELITWINAFQIKHNAVDSLLKVLKGHGHPELPKTARTLLRTARNVEIQMKSGMEYVCFPLRAEILKQLRRYPQAAIEGIETLELSLNVDGLPLFKSTKSSLWPVLCAFHLKPTHVFPVALCLGSSKPKDLHFLDDTVDALAELLEEGLDCDGRHINIELRCIVCDAPARAMVKNVKLYSGYYGCDRCTQKGLWVQKVTYPEVENLTLRTNDSFRAKTQEEHHHPGVSPFCALPIDMVHAFSVDYMHQSCLGVMKRLILLWLRGKKEFRLSYGNIATISRKLNFLKSFIPNYFVRKPRHLEEVDRWKATEFRQFMLYTGRFALKGVLRPELYEHFMAFSIAMSILVSPRLVETYQNYAHDLLQFFVAEGRNLYGAGFMVYNVHAMLHITSDAGKHGGLDACSAFPFENYLQVLKRLVRSGKSPMAQVVKRLSELDSSEIKSDAGRMLVYKTRPDNGYILSQSSACEVIAETRQKDEDGNSMFLCRVYCRLGACFRDPCDSRIIGVHKGHYRNTRMEVIPTIRLNRPAILIEENEGVDVTFLAVLHEF